MLNSPGSVPLLLARLVRVAGEHGVRGAAVHVLLLLLLLLLLPAAGLLQVTTT